jgi:hypothetical protein
MKKQKNQIYCYDFTFYPQDGVYEGFRDDIVNWAHAQCKKCVWQLELGKKEKKLHYQGRFSLKEKLFLHQIPNELKMSFSITSESAHKDTHYVEKLDTRIEGPWHLKDFSKKIETAQLKIFKGFELRPYQEKILEQTKIFDMRCIDLIYDQKGNIGKSIFSEYCEYMNVAEEIPPFRLMEDIFQWVYGMPKKKAYFVDMPRGMKKDKLGEFYAGIEVIKNGVAYDKRNYAKKVRFDRPRIFIFTNTLPVLSLMSIDRWNIWTIDDNYDLVPMSQEEKFQGDTD